MQVAAEASQEAFRVVCIVEAWTRAQAALAAREVDVRALSSAAVAGEEPMAAYRAQALAAECECEDGMLAVASAAPAAAALDSVWNVKSAQLEASAGALGVVQRHNP